PNSCFGSGNGEVTARRTWGTELEALAGGSAVPTPTTPAVPPCSVASRFGDHERLVPGAPTSVSLCVGADTEPRFELTERERQALVAALNGLRTFPTTATCSPGSATPDDVTVVVGYPDGPPVGIRLSKVCRPGAQGGGLQAEDPGPVYTVLDPILARRSPPSVAEPGGATLE
ncbi:MAG: hypothetical protein ACRCZP_18105, partial [Phycicoccus sp.]